MARLLSVITKDVPGVLARIVGLISRRGLNIVSLTADVAAKPDEYCITVLVDGAQKQLQQVTKQIHKLIDTLKASDLSSVASVKCESCLVKVRVANKNKSKILRLAKEFKAKVVDSTIPHTATVCGTMMLRAIGEKKDIDLLVKRLKPFGIVEIARGGIIGLRQDGPKKKR